MINKNENLCSEIGISGDFDICYLGLSEEQIISAEKEMLWYRPLKEQIEYLIKKNNKNLLIDLIKEGNIVIDDNLNDLYEDIKYNNVFKENATTHYLEVLILNHYLEIELEKREKEKRVVKI